MPRTLRSLLLLTVCVFAALPLWPQAAVPRPSFEAASIREHEGPLGVMKRMTISGTLIKLEGYTPHMLVQEAYDLKPYEVAYAEQPLSVTYEIMARASGDLQVGKAETRQMLQTLLAGRFKLKVHRESRDLDVFVLTIAKNGSKLKSSRSDGECRALIGPVRQGDRNYRYSYTHCPLSSLADSLSASATSRPVLERTGLTGNYDFAFAATPDFQLQNSSETGDVSVFDALQSELGLRLEALKAPIDVLVIDHIEKPSEN